MRVLTTLLAALALAAGNGASALTQAEYDDVKTVLRNFFLTETGKGVVATVIRLGFHDCVSGCDGCINVDNPDNAGLDPAIVALETVFQDNAVGDVMSRADFWAMAAYSAVENGVRHANQGCDFQVDPFCNVPALEYTYRWGREDCEGGGPYTDNIYVFPSPLMSGPEVVDYFNQTFNFDETDTVAILGAHTMGACHREFSGYAGSWITGEAGRFDNRFYSIMVDETVDWQNVDVSKRNRGLKDRADSKATSRRWQWDGYNEGDGSKAGMMLNTDFSLFYDLELDEEGEAGCDVSSGGCAEAETHAAASAYAADVDAWMVDFGRAFEKMLENGYDQLSELE